jgi:hypothetical protein
MDAESLLSAQDCVANGLATGIAEDDENDDAAMALARSFKALARMTKLPEKLRADAADGDGACECYCAPCQDDRCLECECRGCDAENCGANNCECAGSESADGAEADAPDAKAELARMQDQLRLIELTGK